MAIKHYMSIFIDASTEQAIKEAAEHAAASKSRIGRTALEFYLGLSAEVRDWLERQAVRSGTSASQVLDKFISGRITEIKMMRESIKESE